MFYEEQENRIYISVDFIRHKIESAFEKKWRLKNLDEVCNTIKMLNDSLKIIVAGKVFYDNCYSDFYYKLYIDETEEFYRGRLTFIKLNAYLKNILDVSKLHHGEIVDKNSCGKHKQLDYKYIKRNFQ
jgi:predicted metallo-beta-lactamase superfamily hydrolase